jgi:hypothetical protein
MNNELQELMQRISKLCDEDLLSIVYIDSLQYRPEAIAYAKAEIERRGIATDQVNPIHVSTPASKENLAALGYKVLTSIRRNAFTVGFFAVLLFFVGANVYSYMVMPNEPRLADGFEQYGFPFNLYMYGGLAGMSNILWEGLIANLLIAMGVGISMGLTSKLLLGMQGNRPAV